MRLKAGNALSSELCAVTMDTLAFVFYAGAKSLLFGCSPSTPSRCSQRTAPSFRPPETFDERYYDVRMRADARRGLVRGWRAHTDPSGAHAVNEKRQRINSLSLQMNAIYENRDANPRMSIPEMDFTVESAMTESEEQYMKRIKYRQVIGSFILAYAGYAKSALHWLC